MRNATNEDFEHLNEMSTQARARLDRVREKRARLDFSVTKAQLVAQIRGEWPDFSDADLDRLIANGRIDWRVIDGEKRFLRNAVDSLRLYPAEVPGLCCPPADRTAQLAVLDEMREKGHATRRIRLRASIRANDDVSLNADTPVMAWLPVPTGPQVADVRILDATPGVLVAPADAPQRTAFWDVRGVREFHVEYDYLIRAPYVDLWADKPAAVPSEPRFSPAPDPTSADLAQQEPHVVFTPYLRELADQLFAGIPVDNQLARARAAYDWVTTNVDYRFQPAYLLLDSIADYAAQGRRADCGVFAILFMTLCRLGGVPARWQSGLYATPTRVGNHDWAMFWVDGMGWLWADCSFGSAARREGDEARRRFYFGNIGPWRMPANHEFFSQLAPADPALRNDPFDSQLGEMCVGGRGLTSYDFTCERTAEFLPL